MLARLGELAGRMLGLSHRTLLLWAALLVGALVGASAISYTLYIAAADVDQAARATEEQLVVNGLQMRQAEIRKSIRPQVIWDDAVLNLDLRFDAKWAAGTLVEFFTETEGYELIYLLDAQDRALLAHATVGDAGRTLEALRPALAALVADVQAQEARRGPIRPHVGTVDSNPIDASAMVSVDGRPFVIAASLVQPDFGKMLPSDVAPIVVIGEAVDADFLGTLSRYYLLRDLRLERGAADPAFARAPLVDREGRTLAMLAWRPDTPAYDRQILKALLEPLGAEVQLVDDGAAAVRAMAEGGFDLVLMDAQMPGMDGITAASEIRALEARLDRPRTPILAVTANVMADQVEAYRAAGMDGWVAKPISLGDLIERMDSVLSAAATALDLDRACA